MKEVKKYKCIKSFILDSGCMNIYADSIWELKGNKTLSKVYLEALGYGMLKISKDDLAEFFVEIAL